MTTDIHGDMGEKRKWRYQLDPELEAHLEASMEDHRETLERLAKL